MIMVQFFQCHFSGVSIMTEIKKIYCSTAYKLLQDSFEYCHVMSLVEKGMVGQIERYFSALGSVKSKLSISGLVKVI